MKMLQFRIWRQVTLLLIVCATRLQPVREHVVDELRNADRAGVPKVPAPIARVAQGKQLRVAGLPQIPHEVSQRSVELSIFLVVAQQSRSSS